MTWAVTSVLQDGVRRAAMALDVESGVGQVVCFEAFRREREQRQARVLPYLAPSDRRLPRSPFSGAPLNGREVEHRQRMLRHLAEEAAT